MDENARSLTDNRMGLYEKALPSDFGWAERLNVAARAGYAFVEMSIDESEDRLRRLYWSKHERRQLRTVLADAPVGIETMCLSAHRRFPMGSEDRNIATQARDMLKRAMELALETGIRVIQIAGYDVFYEPSTPSTRERFLEALHWAAESAAEFSIMLGMENIDRPNADSIDKVNSWVKKVGSPWFQIYGDFGNSAASGYDIESDLQAGQGHLVGMHLKDTLPGQYRNVPFGAGTVSFDVAFKALDRIGYAGQVVVEMWNETDPLAERVVAGARTWLLATMARSCAGITSDT